MEFDIKDLKLKPREIRLVEAVVSGEERNKAYFRIYKPNCSSDKKINMCKSVQRILAKPNVAKYMSHLVDQADKQCIISFNRALANLSKVAEGEFKGQTAKIPEVVRANETLAKMLKEAKEEAKNEEDRAGAEEGNESDVLKRIRDFNRRVGDRGAR